MFQSEILRNPTNASPELRDFFYHHPPSFFQSLHFLELLNGTHGFRPFMLIIKQDRRILATLCGTNIREGSGLKAWASERTVIYGHPVIGSGSDPALMLGVLLEELNHVSQGSLFTQFRNDTAQSVNDPAFRNAGFHWRDRLNLIKPIHNLEEAWATLSASRKRQINSSRKHGIEVISNPSHEQMLEFYNQLLELYRYKVRKPLPSSEFFERFYSLSTNGSFHGKIILCAFKGKIVSGIVCPYTPGASMYEWYVCGLDEEYRSHKIFPSVMATWAAIEAGNQLGCKSFDFMGLGIPSRPYGVREFKSRFGGEWVNHGRWSRVNNSVFYTIAEIGYNMMRILRNV
ncbi:MAG: GNAT family N-acetyltransferase [Bacteroidales bacterium]|nr:GNAT family N-acetyltransferase [Bacteroidales bacterium]